MRQKPLFHALIAIVYIYAVASVMAYGPVLFPIEVPLLIIASMLSLLVFSVAVMGYLFVAAPFLLVAEAKPKEAVSFFFQTLGYFGGIGGILIVVIVLFSH